MLDEGARVVVTSLDTVAAHQGPDGVIWALGGPRQLEANLVSLTAGGAIAEHRNTEVDVLILVLNGSGYVVVDGADKPLHAHDIALIARNVARAITAGPIGMRYLSIHRTRAAPSISRRRT